MAYIFNTEDEILDYVKNNFDFNSIAKDKTVFELMDLIIEKCENDGDDAWCNDCYGLVYHEWEAMFHQIYIDIPKLIRYTTDQYGKCVEYECIRKNLKSK